MQIKQIQNSASISLRKRKTKGKKYTAGDLKSDDYVNKLIQLDEGFRVLRNLRGSPPYFEKCKKDLFAMIRQLGNPTWFCLFSAAETRWVHLLKTLGRLHGGVCAYIQEGNCRYKQLKDLNCCEDHESLWLYLRPNRLPRGFSCIIAGVIYHPPRA